MTESADDLLARACCVHDADAVNKAIAQTAIRIDLELRGLEPVLLAVLQGGLYFTGQLMSRLRFPLRQGSLHVSRYGSNQPGELVWHAPPTLDIAGQDVLLIDDVFDEGLTLDAVVSSIRSAGAKSVRSAVLVNKDVAKKSDYRPEFVALECGDEYLFGCGMDVSGFWRNLPAIYALR